MLRKSHTAQPGTHGMLKTKGGPGQQGALQSPPRAQHQVPGNHILLLGRGKGMEPELSLADIQTTELRMEHEHQEKLPGFQLPL